MSNPARIDDADVKAMENRLRTAGWANKPKPFLGAIAGKRRHLKTHKIEPDGGFGVLETKVREAGLWLAEHRDEAEWPIRQFIADRFGLSYDDAVRAVHEAERLSGESL